MLKTLMPINIYSIGVLFKKESFTNGTMANMLSISFDVAIVAYARPNSTPESTRSVQKLLEHVTNQEQRLCIMSALTPSVVALSTNTNGLHVVDHCVKHFSSEDTKVN
ncbi:hypothetical protein HN51_054866, partial [Arachis hypogaea]